MHRTIKIRRAIWAKSERNTKQTPKWGPLRAGNIVALCS